MTEINDKAQLDIAAADDTDAVTSDTPEETVNTPEVDETFELSAAKMREHGMSETAINQFHHLYDVWRPRLQSGRHWLPLGLRSGR